MLAPIDRLDEPFPFSEATTWESSKASHELFEWRTRFRV